MSTPAPFAHLHVRSEYSFLDGASRVGDLARRAAELGMPFLALTDRDSVAGVLRFAAACEQYAVRPVLGAEVTLDDASSLVLLAETRAGYADLCRLLSLARDADVGEGSRLLPRLSRAALFRHAEGLICLTGAPRAGRVPSLLLARRPDEAEAELRALRDAFGPRNLFVELVDDRTPGSARLCAALADLAARLGVGTVAANDVRHADRDGFAAHDLLCCVREGVTLAAPHPGRPLNAERHLKGAGEMARLFAAHPKAVANAVRVAERCADGVSLPLGADLVPRGGDAQGGPARLRELAYRGAAERYGRVTEKVRSRLEEELSLICALGFADYLLLCHDAVRWARADAGMRCTGRGSAADSCVAYCLYLTDVDVIKRGLPFARFLAPGKTPDVDVDFPSHRRDEVFRHLQARYGADRVGMACTFYTFHARSAVRDAGKALGLPPEVLAPLSERLHPSLTGEDLNAALSEWPELREKQGEFAARFARLFDLCGRVAGLPRHMGTHSSGVVVSPRAPLTAVAPLVPSAKGVLPVWTLDKDDAETAGAVKFDVLALRVLSAVGDAERDIARAADPSFRYDAIPDGDARTYRLLRSGRGIGVFQFESAAQLALSVSLLPREMEDLVAAVALIRPGPVRGNVVQRFVAARNGWSKVEFLHPCLEPILAKTYGCVVFQEQADLCIAAMLGVSHAEAEKLRKSLKRHDRDGTMDDLRRDFVARACARHGDLSAVNATRLFNELAGWAGYGFIEGHAASFALTGYRTAYLSAHHPAAYFAGLLSHQPMGFYPPNSLAAEARRRGVTVLPVDVNASPDRCHAPAGRELRLGLCLVSGLREAERAAIVAAREQGGPFLSLLDFCVRVVLRRDRLEDLVLCGAFDSLHGAESRRGLLLALDETLSLAAAYRAAASGSGQGALPFGDWRGVPTPCRRDVPEFSPWDRFRWSWRVTGVCADAHPMAWRRDEARARGFLTVVEALEREDGEEVTVAGLNIRPHRPPTRSGRRVLFTTVEDETGILQLVCADPNVQAACTATILLAPVVTVTGRVERKARGNGVSLILQDARGLPS